MSVGVDVTIGVVLTDVDMDIVVVVVVVDDVVLEVAVVVVVVVVTGRHQSG